MEEKFCKTLLDVQKRDSVINVCYASDKKYAKLMTLSIATVLSSKSPEDNICFYIIDGGLTEQDKINILDLKHIANCEISFVEVDVEKFKNCPVPDKYLSVATYYRLGLAELIPDVDKIIYLDCDIEVKTSLSELFDTDISEYAVAGVPDISSNEYMERLKLPNYCNAGVLLINLANWRKIDFLRKILAWIGEHHDMLKLYDQDAINIYLQESLKVIDKKWNVQARLKYDDYESLIEGASIIHFIGRDKGDFVFLNLKNVLKTRYKFVLLKMYFARVLKFVLQWVFRVRNKNKTQKEVTVLGFKFYINRK